MKTDRKTRSSGSATNTGYRVEARDTMFLSPIILRHDRQEHVITKEWNELPIWLVPDFQGVGIPCKGGPFGCEMFTYEAALAFAYKFLAELGYGRGWVELRLVQYKLETTHSFWREGLVKMEPLKETWSRDINIETEPPAQPTEPSGGPKT